MLIKSSWLFALAFFATSCSDAEDDVIVDSEPDVPVYNEKPIVATVNFKAVWGDKDANIASMLEYIEDAKGKDVDILLFPELALTGYSADSEDMVSMAESVDGESATVFAELADEYDMYIAYGAPETSDDATKAYNSLFVCTPDGDVESYQAISTDMAWSVEGAELKTISTYWGDMGLSVGTEIFRLPEIGRIYAAKYCELILNATAIGVDSYTTTIPDTAVLDQYNEDFYAYTSDDYYRIQRENNTCIIGLYILYSNLSGDSSDSGEEFIGNSIVMGPNEWNGSFAESNFLYYPGSDSLTEDEGIICATLDLDLETMCPPQEIRFQPELYTEWYSNIATPVIPTASANPVCAVVNMDPVWSDNAANFATMMTYIEDAATQNVDILVFPELCLTDYACTSEVDGYKWQSMIDNAVTLTSEYPEAILAKAIEYDMFIVYGAPEVNSDDATHPYNSAFVASPLEKTTLSYRKIHVMEGDWCTWGTDPLIVSTPWGGMGVSICKDTYEFPEISRYYALSGCKLYANPTAVGGYVTYNFAYNSTLSSTAMRDCMVLLNSDLVGYGVSTTDGVEDDVYYPGKSMIVGKTGTSALYYTETTTEEGMYIATPDLSDYGFDSTSFPVDVLSAAYGAL